MMSETLFSPLALGSALAVTMAVQDRKQGMWVLGGALAGVATLTRVEGLLLVACVAVPAAWLMNCDRSLRLRAVAIVAVVVISVVTPWVIRNAARVHDATIATVSSGTAVGGANCKQSYYGRGLGSWDFDCTHPELRSTLDESRWSARARDTGETYATAHLSRLPIVVAARIGRVAGVWSPGEQADRESLETRSRRWQWLVGISSPLVVSAGPAGLVLLGRRRRGVSPLVGLVATSALVAAIGYGNTRFRSTAEPALLIGVAILVCLAARGPRGRHTSEPASRSRR